MRGRHHLAAAAEKRIVGDDRIDGGSGSNALFETIDANLTLTNDALTATPLGAGASTVETLANIQSASLSGITRSIRCPVLLGR